MASSHQVSLCSAFLIHARPYRETSLIADLFTEEQGRVSVLFKGVRGGRARHKGLLQPFGRLLVSWQGQRELKTATDVEAAATPIRLQGHYLFCALYVNELLQRLLQPQDPHPELFTLYTRLLQSLDEAADLEPTLRAFELQLLELMGYGLPLEAEAISGAALVAEGYYQYDPEAGFFSVLPGSGERSQVYRGEMLLALARGELHSPEQRLAAKRLMRHALAHLLGGRPLRSRELFV
ncbi:DNA repair protein RecO [Aestuariirhabdus litorea]|uniref:DNA repair protein RecO n=1 Tax=Aestuariirhabdus litorea TaxID=2528527 RepID=A0A3P3VR98_9GAMM|nr:DNA repair protein RecO [Aestuariirhabdus litorea]RRJ85150.1 DNA repair protein RecO [Aestuariirhabdus litorea]RWW98373.1 DNA repair protein RecO [Endozoicomonadaceae bacterium GTF-13]